MSRAGTINLPRRPEKPSRSARRPTGGPAPLAPAGGPGDLSRMAPVPAATQDPVSQILVAVIIAGVFALLALEKAHRVLVIFSAVALLWLITYLTPYRLIGFEAAHHAIDLNVILLLASMMAVVGVLKTTGVFGWAVHWLVERSGGRPATLLALVIWFTGIVSAVCDNVTTVLFVFPMVMQLDRKSVV